ncbi:MAG: hypothetical protein WBW48_23005, partial [Anaerolineae bacterium]
MGRTASKPKPKPQPKTQRKGQRFNQATPKERRAKVKPPALTLNQNLMSQLLPSSVLTTLARSRNAGDVRQRKLTCTVFFWMTLLA